MQIRDHVISTNKIEKYYRVPLTENYRDYRHYIYYFITKLDFLGL